MFILPVPKANDNSYFNLVVQNQQKSFILTWLEDFKRNPLSANPYLVLTVFDELVRTKDLALMRGDVISHMTRSEGTAVMQQVLDSYLVDHEYETVRKFNHEPQSFDFEDHTTKSIERFRVIHTPLKKAEDAKKEAGKSKLILGPQSHSKPAMPMVPGGEVFILDEVNKIKKRTD